MEMILSWGVHLFSAPPTLPSYSQRGKPPSRIGLPRALQAHHTAFQRPRPAIPRTALCLLPTLVSALSRGLAGQATPDPNPKVQHDHHLISYKIKILRSPS